jgi:Ca-activated chloride channel family protein
MGSILSGFHFSQPAWLWALLLCIPVAMWLMVSPRFSNNDRLRNYADAHLLPYLIGRSEVTPGNRWKRYLTWTGIWVLLVLAMAGPRWDYRDEQLFKPGSNLVVLFDISRSMNVKDVRPDRLTRARQEVEDLLEQNRGVRIGLIAFASIAHVVSPITEDMNSIRRVLSALDPDLVRLQGSRLSFALERAESLMAGQPEGSTHSLLVITDGDFDEQGLSQRLERLADNGVRVHILGIGTPEGDSVPSPRPNSTWITQSNGQPVVSPLNEKLLRELASAGGGIYQRADYRDKDTIGILAQVKAQALPEARADERTRVWNERFYWLAGLALLLLLPLFRRNLPSYRPID